MISIIITTDEIRYDIITDFQNPNPSRFNKYDNPNVHMPIPIVPHMYIAKFWDDTPSNDGSSFFIFKSPFFCLQHVVLCALHFKYINI